MGALLRSLLMSIEKVMRRMWELNRLIDYVRRLDQTSVIIPLDPRSKDGQIPNFQERLPGEDGFRPQSTDKFEIPEDFPKRTPLHGDEQLKLYGFELRRALMLIFSTIVVIGTYRSASRSASTKGHSPDSLFISCNSALFVASLCVVIHLLNHFQLKPWPQIAFSMLFGCYILISPAHVFPLLVLSIPLLLLAASGKLSGTGEP